MEKDMLIEKLNNLNLAFSMVVTTISEIVEHLEQTDTVGDKKEIKNKDIKVETPNKEETKKEVKKDIKKEEIKKNTKEEVKETTQSITYTLKEIEKMTYNQLKALAKEFNLKATGTKDTIKDNILEHLGLLVDADITEEVEENIEENNTNGEVEDTSEEYSEENTLYDKVEEYLKDYSLEEIADVLTSIGVSSKGKRQALLNKVVRAIEMDLLELDFDGEYEDEEEETPKEETNITSSDLLDGVSETRKPTILKLFKELDESINDGSVTREELISILDNYYDGNDKLTTEDLLIEVKKIYRDLVDDEGVENDFSEPYVLHDTNYCCARELEETTKGTLQCPICNEEYEE